MSIRIYDYYHLFPDEDGSLKKRLQSQSEKDRQGAEFELLLHEMFRRAGCQLTPHPKISGSSETPDFLVDTPDGKSFFLEATVVTGTSDHFEKSEARKRPLLEKLYRLRREGIYLEFGIYGTPEQPVATRAIIRRVQDWLACLSVEAVRRRRRYLTNHAERYPRYRLPRLGEREPEWKEPDPPSSPAEKTSLYIILGEECHLIVVAWPEDEVPAGIPLQVLCQPFFGEPGIKAKLAKKARKYGPVDKPLLVAVNVMRHFGSSLSDVGARFSEEILGYRDTNFDEDGNLVDGAYINGVLSPTANRKVSGVLVFTKFDVKHLQDSYARWIINPWARIPLTNLPVELPPYDPESYQIDATPNGPHLLGLR
ncbi:hypothetical protein [Caenispirillum bisanense]|uniref:Restriction endonuclease n=1 Tax=Caenispirillum bisanense TaxID=414052 RepID=A0A286GFH3_9PROT|nr:hypothetical protein [Caenispirillum bisanense]SOD94273.1 hypothetical protein SAMN05421508_103441 [Caenispirillum bisanense]